MESRVNCTCQAGVKLVDSCIDRDCSRIDPAELCEIGSRREVSPKVMGGACQTTLYLNLPYYH